MVAVRPGRGVTASVSCLLTLVPVVQTPLQANKDDSLATAGICAGDLLWVLESNPSQAAATSGPADSAGKHFSSATAQRVSNPVGANTETAPDSSIRQTASAQPSQNDVVMTDANAAMDQHTIPANTSHGFKHTWHKTFVRLGNPSDASCRLIAAVHAAMLNQHFRPCWLSQVGCWTPASRAKTAPGSTTAPMPGSNNMHGLCTRRFWFRPASGHPQ